VTDAYERLINPRDPGEEGLTPDAALEEILAGANSAFDPEVVSAFRRMMQKHPDLAMAPPPSAPLLAVPEQANQDEEQAEGIEQSQGHQERPASEESS